jgi:putative ABC transport system substrate-binding protein
MARVLPFVMASRKPTVGTYPEWGTGGAFDVLFGRPARRLSARRDICRENPWRREPGDLPIEQASKFTLVVNARTAKQLGISVPPTLLTLADEVIE